MPLAALEWGRRDGPAILFIHGFAQGADLWRPMMDGPLAAEFRMAAFDLRGHGDSGKPWSADGYDESRLWADDVAAVIAALDLHRPVLVAANYGGMIVMDYVRHRGVGGIAGINLVQTQAGLMGPYPVDPETQAFYARQAKLHASPVLEDNLEAVRTTARQFVADPPPQEWLDRMVALGLRMPPHIRRVISGRPFNNADLLPKLNIPVLLSVGTRVQLSADAPLEIVTGLAQRLPDGRLSVYADTGRSPFTEATARFEKELSDFVRAAQR
ncbi:MAG: alpha/beta hydrolase [Rhodospirillaceae bacterium]|nr:alpha/beta hydrolase [Rhodospirillaceae bacterium]